MNLSCMSCHLHDNQSKFHHFSSLRLCDKISLIDEAAAKANVAVVENDRLARGHSALGLEETDASLALFD